MFSVLCPKCSTTVLLNLDQIVALTRNNEHWVVDALCWCDEPVTAELRWPAPRRPQAGINSA